MHQITRTILDKISNIDLDSSHEIDLIDQLMSILRNNDLVQAELLEPKLSQARKDIITKINHDTVESLLRELRRDSISYNLVLYRSCDELPKTFRLLSNVEACALWVHFIGMGYFSSADYVLYKYPDIILNYEVVSEYNVDLYGDDDGKYLFSHTDQLSRDPRVWKYLSNDIEFDGWDELNNYLSIYVPYYKHE